MMILLQLSAPREARRHDSFFERARHEPLATYGSPEQPYGTDGPINFCAPC